SNVAKNSSKLTNFSPVPAVLLNTNFPHLARDRSTPTAHPTQEEDRSKARSTRDFAFVRGRTTGLARISWMDGNPAPAGAFRPTITPQPESDYGTGNPGKRRALGRSARAPRRRCCRRGS